MKIKQKTIDPVHAFISYLTALFIFPFILGTILTIVYNAQLNLLQVELEENKYE